MSLNFKLSEFIQSRTAILYKINNMPDISSLDNLLNLIFYVMQPLRDKLKRSITITSGYRCKQLNLKVGGASNSEHLTGKACDFLVNGLTVKQVCLFIRNSGIKYTQLIEEHSKNAQWVHISYDTKNLKCEYLIYQNGKYTKA